MKISEYQIYPVAVPPPHFGGECWLFVLLRTDSGIEGVGEVYSVPFRPDTVATMIADVCERYVIGSTPFSIESTWHKMYSGSYTRRPDPSLQGVMSGIEMAMWDIVGKELNKPVHALLGGKVRERLRTYTYLYPAESDTDNVYTNPSLAAARALEYADEGFTAIKFDPVDSYTAFDPRQLSLQELERSADFVREIRAAVGTRCDLLFGTHGQMTPSAAIRLAKRLEPSDPLWLEEPTPPDNPAAMAKVAQATSIPVAAGERLTTKYEFANLLSHGAASIVQPNCAKCGGILEGKKIAAIAESHYAQVAPHLYCGPVAGAANMQLSACIPNFLILESIRKWDGFSAQILNKVPIWESGYLIVPETAGLGVELNKEVAEKNRYTGDKAMGPYPMLQPHPL